MSTTSLKLPDALKERIQHFASESRVSTHAFMVSTLESEIERLEARAGFEASAAAAAADIDAGGPVYELDEVRRHIEAKLRAGGSATSSPRALKAGRAPSKSITRRR